MACEGTDGAHRQGHPLRRAAARGRVAAGSRRSRRRRPLRHEVHRRDVDPPTPLALVAEVVGAALARALGLRVPELVVVDLDPALGRAEPDPEIQDLLTASPGTNLGVDFLPGALAFDGALEQQLDPEEAARVLWLDALILNVDRTPRNPNLLRWHRDLWLIDHGAALHPLHRGALADSAGASAARIAAGHVLARCAAPLTPALDERLAAAARDAAPAAIAAVPAAWAEGDVRDQLTAFLDARLPAPRAWVTEAQEARGG